MKTNDKLPLPSLGSDAEAEEFVANADLSKFKSMRFEVAPKSSEVNMRLPSSLL